jgi:outer membrane protein assembly factor BamB
MGTVIWQVVVIDPLEHRKGIFSSPAVTDETVILGTWGSYFSCPTLFGLDRTTTTLKWSAILDHSIIPSPSVANGVVYARSGGAGWSGDIIAFNEETGAEIWRAGVGPTGEGASPAIANGMVYTADFYNIYAFNAMTGERN